MIYIRTNWFLLSSFTQKIQLKWLQVVWACRISQYSPWKYVEIEHAVQRCLVLFVTVELRSL